MSAPYNFADDVIAALGNPSKGIHSAEVLKHEPVFKQRSRASYNTMRKAVRFVLDDKFIDFAMEASMKATATDLMDQFALFRLPHPTMWIEWNEKKRQSTLRRVADSLGVESADRGDSNHPDNADYVGYLFEDSPASAYEHDAYMATAFMPIDEKVAISPVSLMIAALAEESGWQDHHIAEWHKEWTQQQSSQKNIEKYRTQNIASVFDTLGPWWIQQVYQDTPQEAAKMGYVLGSHMRLIQGTGIDFFPQSYREWREDTASIMTKAGMDMMRGDSRFLITVMAILNYDWIIKTPKEPSSRKYRFGKFHRGNAHIEVSLDLPKWQGVTINAKGFGANETLRRQHGVRGHWRYYRKTGQRVWIDAHLRGDPKLGVITKDYTLTHRSK